MDNMVLTAMARAGDFASYATADWVGIGLAIGLVVILGVLAVLLTRKLFIRLTFGLAFLALIPLILFQLWAPLIILALFLASLAMAVSVSGARSFHDSIAHSFKHIRHRRGTPEEVETTELVKKVAEAIEFLASHKIGAIIAFQKSDAIDIPQDACIIDARFVPALVETIFFPNTQLHDLGMVVIGDTIHAAAVRFPSTTRTFTGKFGSRHRAAIGLSEQVDAVIVIVSEETGKVSIAHRGSITQCSIREFPTTFKNYMLVTTPYTREEKEKNAKSSD